MKQHITVEQWNELEEDKQQEIRKVLKGGKFGWMQLSIGQMIEFLGDSYFYTIQGKLGPMQWTTIEFLCDALWEAVKEVLNES